MVEAPVKPSVETVRRIAEEEGYVLTDEEAEQLASLSEEEIRTTLRQWKTAQALIVG